MEGCYRAMKQFNVLDLFSGIGGFSLGLERTGGFNTSAFCEIEDYPRRVLRKHWPEVPCYEDVRTLTSDKLAADGIAVNVICGGFPCQDLSIAGNCAGIDAERSGLWSEFSRLIGELRPRYVIVENVANLLAGPSERPGWWFGRVLGDLAALGYNAEWHCIPASAIGAEHDRDRVWIIAYPDEVRELQPQGDQQDKRGRSGDSSEAPSPNSDQTRRSRGMQARADGTHVARFEPWLRSAINNATTLSREHWNHQPVLGRGVHGVSHRLDRIGCLGNAVFPYIPELIGRAILFYEANP